MFDHKLLRSGSLLWMRHAILLKIMFKVPLKIINKSVV